MPNVADSKPGTVLRRTSWARLCPLPLALLVGWLSFLSGDHFPGAALNFVATLVTALAWARDKRPDDPRQQK